MRKLLMGVLMIMIIVTSGCSEEKTQDNTEVNKAQLQNTEQAISNGSTNTKEVKLTESQQEQIEEVEKVVGQLETTQSEKLEKQIESEPTIIGHNIFIAEKFGVAGGELIFSEEAKDEKAKEIAEKYAKQLKTDYPDLGVVVKVKRGEQEISIIELK